MPYDVAFNLDEAERLAYGIIFGQFEGGEWNFDTGRWKDRK